MENIDKRRFYSFIVDLTISNMISVIIFSILNVKSSFYESNIIVLNSKINYGLSFQIITVFLYFIMFDLFNHGVSFGKSIFSIRVISKKNLDKLNVNDLLKRTFLKIISIIILPFSLISFFLYKGFTIQDKYTNTKTISTTSK